MGIINDEVIWSTLMCVWHCVCINCASNAFDTFTQELMSHWRQRRSVQIPCTPGCHQKTNLCQQPFPIWKCVSIEDLCDVLYYTVCVPWCAWICISMAQLIHTIITMLDTHKCGSDYLIIDNPQACALCAVRVIVLLVHVCMYVCQCS